MSHDASATWSGFNYQGKVALYHSLKIINKMLDEGIDVDFAGYELILENYEDFDIKEPNGFKSFHQVKAMNETAFNKYEDALFAMLLQLDNPMHSSVTGYLHTWKTFNWIGNDSFKQKLQGIANKVVQNNSADPATSYLTKAFTEASGGHKWVKILRKAREEDNRLVDIASTLAVITKISTATQPQAVVNRVKQYAYNGALSCCIESIDEKVKAQIGSLLGIRGIDYNDQTKTTIFCYLLAKLDENIILKHSTLSNNLKNPIAFSEILAIVDDNCLRDSDDAYLAASFKLQFVESFEKYLDDEELCSLDDAEAYVNKESNLNTVMELLLGLSSLELWSYFKSLNPHLLLATDSAILNAQNINLPHLRQYLFNIFNELNCEKFEYNAQQKVVHYRNNYKYYLPTAIGKDSKKTLVKSIMENSNAIPYLYEISAMITGDENAPEIERFSDEYTKLVDRDIEEYYEDSPPKNKEKITQIFSEIRLIKLSTAIGEIN